MTWQWPKDLDVYWAEMAIACGRVVVELEQLVGAADEGINTSVDFGGTRQGLMDVVEQREILFKLVGIAKMIAVQTFQRSVISFYFYVNQEVYDILCA